MLILVYLTMQYIYIYINFFFFPYIPTHEQCEIAHHKKVIVTYMIKLETEPFVLL